MSIVGTLAKMPSRLEGDKVAYQLPVGDQRIDINAHIGSDISLNYMGEILCGYCGRRTKKSWSQGFCFPCSQTLARCDMCIVRPERCHYHLGTCREPKWGEDNCFKPHIIYLANSSGVKVGITRAVNIPQRWIDQGAVQALPILAVTNRLSAGKIEIELAKSIADKTNWQAMLKNQVTYADLPQVRDDLLTRISALIAEHKADVLTETVVNIDYPVDQYPQKITSLNFDKTAAINGQLMGIKGQYLILSSGVINIRKFSGYQIEFN